MIRDSHSILVKATPQDVFKHLAAMPGKFPVFKALESWPLLAVRVFLIGSFKSGLKMLVSRKFFRMARENMRRPLSLGDSFGPFTLSEIEQNERYFFSFATKLFELEAGYTIRQSGNETFLSLEMISHHPSPIQKIYWQPIKPFHNVLARKTLSVIKREIENRK